MTLTALRVRDLATIADATLDLGPGLNVLTGETGAGKSMLIDALALLLGDRADRAAVRPGADRAVVEGTFEGLSAEMLAALDAAGLDRDDPLVARREVTREGRSRAWINGSPVAIGALATVGAALVDLHGQHQTVHLLDPLTQRGLVDRFARAEDAVRLVAEAHVRLADLRARVADLVVQRDAAQRRADWLRHVVREIDDAHIEVGEDDALDRDARRLAQAGTVREHGQHLLAALEDDDAGAAAAIGRAVRTMQALSRIDDGTAQWIELADQASTALEELAHQVRGYLDAISDDPDRLGAIERRRQLLGDLRRRHGATLAEVIATRDAARQELDLLDTADVDLRAMASKITLAERVLGQAAGTLTEKRRDAAARLGREVSRLLPPLGMRDGELRVALVPLDAPGPAGAESIAFEVRLNRGMDWRPLARSASGGELSRVMLALKVVLAHQDDVPTLVFDEIDQGVSGEIGARIGESLVRVSRDHQVLVITHLPQIAARADRHLAITKADRRGIATSDVVTLHGEDRVLELARMLGDADGIAARRLAQEMMRGAAAK